MDSKVLSLRFTTSIDLSPSKVSGMLPPSSRISSSIDQLVCSILHINEEFMDLYLTSVLTFETLMNGFVSTDRRIMWCKCCWLPPPPPPRRWSSCWGSGCAWARAGAGCRSPRAPWRGRWPSPPCPSWRPRAGSTGPPPGTPHRTVRPLSARRGTLGTFCLFQYRSHKTRLYGNFRGFIPKMM